MKINLKLSIAMCAAVLLAACGNNPSGNTGNIATTDVGPPVSLTGSPLGHAPTTAAPVAALIDLGAPVASQAAIAKPAGSSGDGKPLQIGFNRDVAQTGSSNATKQVLKWQATAYEVTGAEVLRVLATNLAAGDKSDAAAPIGVRWFMVRTRPQYFNQLPHHNSSQCHLFGVALTTRLTWRSDWAYALGSSPMRRRPTRIASQCFAFTFRIAQHDSCKATCSM